jgi:hypothetical protein
MKNKKQVTLLCFSPPVMLATMIIEVGLLLFVLTKYGLKSPLRRLVAVTLSCLAIFQLAEYNICGRFNIDALTWSRIGFIAITLLPAFGIHIISIISKHKRHIWVYLSYIVALVWVLFFALSDTAFNTHQCTSNYAIFHLSGNAGGLYFMYYYSLLFAGLIMAVSHDKRIRRPQQKSLHAMAVGYCLFMIPTFVVNALQPETMAGIPSIMCGFAVLFAFVLVFIVLPNSHEIKQRHHRK